MENWAPWWHDGEIGGSRPRIIFKRFNTAPLHSFKLTGPNFNWENLDDMQAEKEYMGPQFPIVRFIFKRLCDDNQCLILVFSVICLDSWGAPSGYFKSFVLSFLFFFFHYFIFFLICFSLGGPFSSGAGPLDIVHPCHPVATPLPAPIYPKAHCNSKMVVLQNFTF